MKPKVTPWDPVRWLESPDRQQGYLAAIIAEAVEDPGLIVDAVGDIARARGMVEIARLAGVSTEEMFNAFIEGGEPTSSTLEKVVAALGCEMMELQTETCRTGDGPSISPHSPQLPA